MKKMTQDPYQPETGQDANNKSELNNQIANEKQSDDSSPKIVVEDDSVEKRDKEEKSELTKEQENTAPIEMEIDLKSTTQPTVNKNYSIKEYETRFLNTLNKLNPPKWLSFNRVNFENENQTISQTNNILKVKNNAFSSCNYLNKQNNLTKLNTNSNKSLYLLSQPTTTWSSTTITPNSNSNLMLSTATATATTTTKQKYDRIKLKNQLAHQQQNYQHFHQANYNTNENSMNRINCSASQICKQSNGHLEIQQFEYYEYGNEYDNLNTDHGYYYYSYNNNYSEYDNIENLMNKQNEVSTNNNNNNNMKNSKSLILLSSYRNNQNNLNNNSNAMIHTKANKYVNRNSTNSEMKRSLSTYNYYRSSSSHSLKPLSISNNSLNKNANTWYKPKDLQLPSSKSQIDINSRNNINNNKIITSICSSVASALTNENINEHSKKEEVEVLVAPVQQVTEIHEKQIETKMSAQSDEANKPIVSHQLNKTDLSGSNSSLASSTASTAILNIKTENVTSPLNANKSSSTTTTPDLNVLNYSSASDTPTQANNPIDLMSKNREKYLISRLGYRNDDQLMFNSQNADEIYDNLDEGGEIEDIDDTNEASYLIDDEEVDGINNQTQPQQHQQQLNVDEFMNNEVTSESIADDEDLDENKNSNESYNDYIRLRIRDDKESRQNNEEILDYENVLNSKPFIMFNQTDSAGNISLENQQISEEYDDENELRNYDDYNSQQTGALNEDEFFLISSPSPFNLKATNLNENDSDNVLNSHLYSAQSNRLSNIIEEEDECDDSQRSSDINNYKEMLILGEQVNNLYKNIEEELSNTNYKPVVKKRVYNLNTVYTNTKSEPFDNERLTYKLSSEPLFDMVDYDTSNNMLATKLTRLQPSENEMGLKNIEQEEEPDSILNYLLNRLSEQHNLKLSDDVLTGSSNANQGYLLTKSLFAQHKQINLNEHLESDVKNTIESELGNEIDVAQEEADEEDEETYENLKMTTRHDNKQQQQQQQQSMSASLITALSINEIETRRSLFLEDDENQIKEEIVLIGERTDIESLLDNKNNQLYNLIMSNTNKTNKLNEIERDLNKERLNRLSAELNEKQFKLKEKLQEELTNQEPEEKQHQQQQQQKVQDENKNVQIEIQMEKNYEEELSDLAKYLVDEITKISVNKVKIDDIHEGLDKKYSGMGKARILDNLVKKESAIAAQANTVETQAQEVKELESQAENNSAHVNKSRNELFDYYSNLEKNLEQVRNEINKLKQEAFDDLAYIKEILTDQDLIDCDQEQVELGEAVEAIEQDDDEEENTIYLSQPASLIKNDNSQVYLTPAESLQTLQNNNKNNSIVNEKTLLNNSTLNDGNQTDLDQDFDVNSDYMDEIMEKNSRLVEIRHSSQRENRNLKAPEQMVKSQSLYVELNSNMKSYTMFRNDEKQANVTSSTNSINEMSNKQANNYQSINIKDRSKSTERPISTTSNGGAAKIEKKSLDKFLKLASNSASLLDLNKTPVTQSTSNLASLCGAELFSPSSTHSSSSTNTQVHPQIHTPIATARTPVKTSNINTNGIKKTISQLEAKPPIVIKPQPPALPAQTPVQRSSKSDMNSASNNNIEKQIVKLQSQTETKENADENGFRIPSSRHFCGRLLSFSTSSQQSTTGSASYSSTTNYSSTRSNSSIEDEKDQVQHGEKFTPSTSSPSTASSSPRSHISIIKDAKFSNSTDQIFKNEPLKSVPNSQTIDNGLSIGNKNQQWTKSFDHLLPASSDKKQLLVKQIDLDSQKDISNIIAANSKQMTLSKSIKDLKLYVSNSFSPSLIVKPPPTSMSTTNMASLSTPTHKREPEPRVNITPILKKQQSPQHQPSQQVQSKVLDEISQNKVNKEKPLPHTNLNIYKTMLSTPLKNEQSDQVRMQYAQQQQMITTKQKQQYQQDRNQSPLVNPQPTPRTSTNSLNTRTPTKQAENSNNYYSTNSNNSSRPNSNRSSLVSKNNYVNQQQHVSDDDTLLNSILDIKPHSLHSNATTATKAHNYSSISQNSNISSAHRPIIMNRPSSQLNKYELVQPNVQQQQQQIIKPNENSKPKKQEVNLNSTNKYINNTQNYYPSSPSTLIKPNMITNASSTFSSVDNNNKLVLNTTNNYPRRIRKETNL